VVATDGIAGYTTYRMSATLANPDMTNLYALYGNADSPLTAPPAFHVAAPFGSDVGGVDPVLFAASPDAEHDSWLTINADNRAANTTTAADEWRRGSGRPALGVLGIPFANWTDTQPLLATDGMIFLPPSDGPTERARHAAASCVSWPDLWLRAHRRSACRAADHPHGLRRSAVDGHAGAFHTLRLEH